MYPEVHITSCDPSEGATSAQSLRLLLFSLTIRACRRKWGPDIAGNVAPPQALRPPRVRARNCRRTTLPPSDGPSRWPAGCPTLAVPLPCSVDPAVALTRQNLLQDENPAIRVPAPVRQHQSKLFPSQPRFLSLLDVKTRPIEQQHGIRQGIRPLLSGEPSPW